MVTAHKKQYQYFPLAAGSLIVLALSGAAAIKLTNLNSVVDTVTASKLVPQNVSAYVALAVPIVEVLISALLLWSKTRKIGFRAAQVLFAVFAGYHAWRWLKHIGVPCSCFGPLFKIDPPLGIGLSLGLCLLAAAAEANLKP